MTEEARAWTRVLHTVYKYMCMRILKGVGVCITSPDYGLHASLCGICRVQLSCACIWTPALHRCVSALSEYSPEVKRIERGWKRSYNVTLGPVRVFTSPFVRLDFTVLILTVMRPVLKINNVTTLHTFGYICICTNSTECRNLLYC